MWCLLFRRQHFQAAFVTDLKSNSLSSCPILITASCTVSQSCQVQIASQVITCVASQVVKLLLLLTTTTTGCILLNSPLFLVQYGILAFANSFKCPDCTGLHLRVLECSEFSGRACPRTPSMSNFGLSLWALTHPYCISPQYAPLRLTNKKCLGTP